MKKFTAQYRTIRRGFYICRNLYAVWVSALWFAKLALILHASLGPGNLRRITVGRVDARSWFRRGMLPSSRIGASYLRRALGARRWVLLHASRPHHLMRRTVLNHARTHRHRHTGSPMHRLWHVCVGLRRYHHVLRGMHVGLMLAICLLGDIRHLHGLRCTRLWLQHASQAWLPPKLQWTMLGRYHVHLHPRVATSRLYRGVTRHR